jgi:spermidine synthase
MDAFTGDATPSHLLSREALTRVHARLNEGGLVALNIMGSTRGDSAALPAVIGTLQTQFSHIALFPLTDPSASGASTGNFVILAGNRPLDDSLRIRLNDVHPLAAPLVHAGLQRAKLLRPDPSLPILTDDFNPLDVLDVKLHETVRRGILESTPANILLHG